MVAVLSYVTRAGTQAVNGCYVFCLAVCGGVPASDVSSLAPRGWGRHDYEPPFHSASSLPNINEFAPFANYPYVSYPPANRSVELEFDDLFDHNHNIMAPPRNKYPRPLVRRHSLPYIQHPTPPLSFSIGGEESQEGLLMKVWEELIEGGSGSLPSLPLHWPLGGNCRVYYEV